MKGQDVGERGWEGNQFSIQISQMSETARPLAILKPDASSSIPNFPHGWQRPSITCCLPGVLGRIRVRGRGRTWSKGTTVWGESIPGCDWLLHGAAPSLTPHNWDSSSLVSNKYFLGDFLLQSTEMGTRHTQNYMIVLAFHFTWKLWHVRALKKCLEK